MASTTPQRSGKLGVACTLLAALCTLRCSPAAPLPVAPSNAQDSVELGLAVAEPVGLPGRDLPLHSSGAPDGASWQLRQSGYVGVYVRVTEPGPVTLWVSASGPADVNEEPRLRLVIADQRREDVVALTPSSHEWSGELRPGTYLLRVEFANAAPGAQRALRVHDVSVSGASLLPDASDRHALDAADTFIRYYRRARTLLELSGVQPGTPVRIRLQRHAFNFGLNVPGATNRLLPEAPAPDSEAARFQRLLLEGFNTVVLSNGGKWLYHEETRDQLALDYVDRFLGFAREHGLRARMHTLLWDTQQQPSWIASEDVQAPGLLTLAVQGDAQARAGLQRQIAERIDYLVRQRAAGYDELDVLNESLHHPRYWQVFGVEGVARLFNDVAAAVQAAGARTQLFLNEYNVLQWSEDPAGGTTQDPYANWYRWHAEELLRAGAKLDGLGVQYYADGRSPTELGENAHSAARIYAALQNLAGTGLALTLSELTVNGQPGVTAERGAQILAETLRLVFGTPAAQSALIWSVYAGAAQTPVPPSALYDERFELTPAGHRHQALMQEWNTDVTLPAPAEGQALELEAFLGEYSLEGGGKLGCARVSGPGESVRVVLEDGTNVPRLDGRSCLKPRATQH